MKVVSVSHLDHCHESVPYHLHKGMIIKVSDTYHQDNESRYQKSTPMSAGYQELPMSCLLHKYRSGMMVFGIIMAETLFS